MASNLLLFPLLATNQHSAALHYYLQAGAVCSDFFNKAVPPDVYTDQVSCFVGWLSSCLPSVFFFMSL